METIDEMQKWVTLGGAVIAASASLLNLWWTLKAKADKIKVSVTPLEPPVSPGNWLHVVSRSDHRMMLKDYGFIDEAGHLLSLPNLWSDEPTDDVHVAIRGSKTLEQRGDIFEVGYVELRDHQIGAFAVTAGQERRTVGFRYDVPWYKRFYIKLKIWWKPKYR